MGADCDGHIAKSILVTGPTPDRYERAGQLLGNGSTVVVSSTDPPTTLDASPAVRSVDADDRELSDVGIAISRRVDELTAPGVLLDLTLFGPIRAGVSLALFRFLLLVRRRVTAAGGRLVFTLDETADPTVRETVSELADRTVRLGTARDWRTAGDLSP